MIDGVIDGLGHDVRFAWRGLLRAPGFTAIAVATLALGMGANSAIFTIVNAVVMRPLPYAHPDRLVRITSDFTGLGSTDIGLSQPELIDYRDRSGLFDGVAGVWAINANLTEVDVPERVEVLLASPSYFDLLGVRPQLGRLFQPEDEGPGITEVLVISDALWRRRFGASAAAIGRKLKVDQDWYTVIGVLPPEFRHPGRSVLTDVDAWAPASFVGKPFPAQPQRFNYFITGAIARLKPGIGIDEARQRLAALARGFRQAYPDAYPARAAWMPRVMPLREDLVGSVRATLLIVFGAVGVVLLIACANIANLLLARASSRQRELAVRRALGSSRLRLVRLLLAESLILALLGGVLGGVLSVWLLDVLLALVPAGLPRLQEIRVDLQVVAFTAVLSLATALLFGMLPALQSSKADVNEALRDGSRGASARGWLRSSLVVIEFALAVVLLVGAALLVRSFWRLQHVDLGFDSRNVLTAKLWLPQPNDPEQGRYSSRKTGHLARVATYDEILRRAESLPGVSAAAAADALPFDGTRSSVVFTAEGTEGDDRSRVPTAQYSSATARYFDVMGIRVLRGRPFGAQDNATGAPVAIVTDAIARASWPGQDAVGKRLHLGGPQATGNPWLTVVGVVEDVRTRRVEDDPRPAIYRPLQQRSGLSLSVALKTDADPDRLRSAFAGEVRAVDADLPTYGVRTLDDMIASATASRRFSTQLLTAFAVLALALAAIGIYGVVAFVVGQRTREMGIRIALGAEPMAVVRLVMRQAFALAAIGVVAGLGAAALLTRLLTNLLFEIRPVDPLTYTLIPAVLAITAAVAAWRPARRAATVDPMTALRNA
jgi:putative ABC transport system permease protein